MDDSDWLAKLLSDRKNHEEQQGAKQKKDLRVQELVKQARTIWMEVRSAVIERAGDFNTAYKKELIVFDPEDARDQNKLTLVVDGKHTILAFSNLTGAVTGPSGAYELTEAEQGGLLWKANDGEVLTSQGVAEREIRKAIVPT